MRRAGGELNPGELAALLAAAVPGEGLSAEELEATLFADPDGAVLAADGGAVGVAVRGDVGFVTVVAVDPARRLRGTGRALVAAAEGWLRARGARSVVVGPSAPRYLWPGLDVDAHRSAIALFEACGYEAVGEHRNHRVEVSFRAPPPGGVVLRRATAGSAEAGAVVAFAEAAFPHWVDEVVRATGTGCCHGAFDEATGAALGVACHSVNRAGWIGPMATDPAEQGRGIGSALLGAVCRDLQLAELEAAEIAWVGPDAFYEKAAGTSVSRRFVVLARRL